MDIYQTFMPTPEITKVESVAVPSSPSEPPFLDKARKELSNGFYFTKYAKGGFNPHDKKISLNDQETKLLSADVKNERELKAV